MSVAKVVNTQRNFSGGEADISLKRADDNPLLKTTGRQMRNWRTLNSGGMTNRPGRRVLRLEGPRVDQVIMSPGNSFYLVFGTTPAFGYLRVYNAAMTKVFDSGNVMPWRNAANAASIVWDWYKFSIYVCFDGMQPQVLTWDGVSQASIWTLTPYAEQITGGGQKRTIFYRLSPRGVTVTSGGITGVVSLVFSAGMNLVNGQINTRMRIANRQLLITAVGTPTGAAGFVDETLYRAQLLTNALDNTQFFDVGNELIGQTSGAKGLIVAFVGVGNNGMTVTMLTSTAFLPTETVVGPNGSAALTSAGFTSNTSITPVWDDEVMNSFRGWPRSCFVDQSRLGFCDFPALPGLIVWSAVGAFDDLYTDSNNVGPTNAIQELVPGKSRVLHVVPGADGSEFVFCDNAVYYIPINQSNPLKPGSVAFNTLSSEGIAPQVKPRQVGQSIVYVSAGNQQLKAVQALGAYNKPYVVDDISNMHSHLLNSPVAIAAPGGSDQFEESYFYICNGDGSIVLCKFETDNGMLNTKTIGYLLWVTGGQSATWISALKGNSDVLVTGTYAAGLLTAVSLVEQIDSTQYLDAGMLYNAAPAALAPPVGKGPLWWIAGGSVDLMDGVRMMGTYQVDANGFLVPQNNAGENFLSQTLAVGQTWASIFEPWVPAVQPGQDVQQRLRKRRIQRFVVYVQNSTGFYFARLFGGPVTRTSPLLASNMSLRRIETWNQDDDPTLAPPLREQTYSMRPLGRLHDPRVAIVKDTPGPLTILEVDLEVSV